MKLRSLLPLAACLSIALPFTLSAQEAKEPPVTLKIGDSAPKLQVGKWLQGDEVKEFEKDKTYIVEFWATWCGPCVATIPHVNDLQKKHADKGLVVIGQNCFESEEQKVAPFVKEMGQKMTYRVAMDDKSKDQRGAMATNWMQASGQKGIPCAFIVGKDQKVVWIGHPGQIDDKLMDEVIAGTFDIAKAAERAQKERVERAAMNTLNLSLSKAMHEKDWAGAEKTIAELEKAVPEENRKFLDLPRFNVLMGQKKADEAYKLADKLSDENPKSAQLQNLLAWGIVSAEGIAKPDGDRAEKYARRALEAAQEKEQARAIPMIKDTLARALFLKGQKDEAIKVQEEALAAGDEQSKPGFEKTLKAYKEGKLPSVATEDDGQ